MIEQGKNKRQEIKMLNRKLLEISGVLNVESFDSEEFLLETECGFLTCAGRICILRISTWSKGLWRLKGLSTKWLTWMQAPATSRRDSSVSCSSEPEYAISNAVDDVCLRLHAGRYARYVSGRLR